MARNKNIDSGDTPSHPLDFSFNPDSLRHLLKEAASQSPRYTHQQICDWARRCAFSLREGENESEEIELMLEIAGDVDIQWELFLCNSFSLEQLQKLDFSTVFLPREWFEKWLIKAVS